MPSFFIGYMPDTFYLVPSIVIKIGRDTTTRKPAAIMLAFQWLCIEAGTEIELYTNRP